MAERLKGKVAIVTGAAQGIGATYAKTMAAEGAAVVIADVVAADAVVKEIVNAGGKAIAVQCNVTDPASTKAMADRAIAEFGKIDILVNNAGLFANLTFKSFLEIDSSEWDKVMAVNVRGPFECAKAVAPHMKKQKYGKIVNIASATVFKGSPMLLHYVTSKGAVVAMTRSLARELGDDGVRVNTLAPGLIMTDNVSANPSWQGAAAANNVASRAIKRDAEPADLAGTLVFMCAPESDFMTGQVIVVDGGSVMH
jgi:NAD(P)-dependent dehydrogenase (short-subunit alcohol dehydrogenase family)